MGIETRQILATAYPEGRDALARELPTQPGAPGQILPVLHKFTNALVQISIQQAEAHGEKVSCVRGCTHCCRHMVPLAPAEVYAVRDLVESMPEPRQSELRRRFSDTLALARETVDTVLASSDLSDEEAIRINGRYLDQNIRCPFLGDDDSCTIYEQRPMVCREFMVTSNPDHCARPTSYTVNRVPMPASAARAMMLAAPGARQGKTPWVPLVAALEWAASNPEQVAPKTGSESFNEFVTNFEGLRTQWVSHPFTLKFGDLVIENQMAVPSAQVQAKQMLPAFRKITDSLVQIGVDASVESGKPISCTKGCGACCRMAVPVAEPEAWRLREVVDAMPEPRRSTIRARFAAAMDHFRPMGLLDILFQPAKGAEAEKFQIQALDKVYAEGIPCPFLEDESCSIYEERPLICRQFLVTSPAKNCANIEGKGVVRVPMLTRPSDGLIWAAAKEGDERMPVLPLAAILEFTEAREQAELRTGPEWMDRFTDLLQVRATNTELPLADAKDVLKVAYPEGPQALAQELPAKPVRPGEMLPVLRKFTNALVQIAAHQAEVQGEKISCTKGCGACCRQMVPLTAPETYQIRDLVASLPEPRQSEVRKRFQEGLERLRGPVDKILGSSDMKDKDAAGVGLDYFAAGVPCPFLEEESCSIHPDRPLVCREFLVTSPAENCSNPSPKTTRRVQLTASAARAFMLAAPGARKGKTPWVPMIAALEWTEANPETETMRTGPQWMNEFAGRYEFLAKRK